MYIIYIFIIIYIYIYIKFVFNFKRALNGIIVEMILWTEFFLVKRYLYIGIVICLYA